MTGIDGALALVTGAGSGLGEASARSLVAHGAKVVVTDVNFPAIERLANVLDPSGAQVFPYRLDVRSESDWIETIQEVEASHGHISLLHSNAGLTDPVALGAEVDFAELSVEIWDNVMNVNTRGAFLACRTVIPSMLRHGSGAIVLTSSITAIRGRPDRWAYTASKGALESLTRGIAARYGPSGIRCNGVTPGPVFMGDPTRAPTNREFPDRMLQRICMPADIAAVSTFLLSDEAAYITAQNIVVDGGLTAKYPLT
jgi:NAD(P)-dependent dehydrogenase (short-subunit alcohol dehydrogenase family)